MQGFLRFIGLANKHLLATQSALVAGILAAGAWRYEAWTDPNHHDTIWIHSFLSLQEMTKSVLLLRLSYWIAAIADFAIAILAWIPERMGVTEIVYPGGLASVIAFSWGVMLLVADRKPIERKWILVPTILVVILIAAIRTKFSLDGSIEFSFVLLLFAVALVILMTFSYYYATKHANDR